MPLTADHAATATQLRSQGMSYLKIAQHFGCSETKVYNHFRIKKPKPPTEPKAKKPLEPTRPSSILPQIIHPHSGSVPMLRHVHYADRLRPQPTREQMYSMLHTAVLNTGRRR